VITVVDTTPPDVTCPPDAAVTLPDPTDPTATGIATATDNCDAAPGVTWSDVESGPQQFCPTITVITRTWTATDGCGLTDDCDQLITVTEPIPEGYCCNPADGTLTIIDDGDPCTDDICNETTGEVTHPDNGLCHACCDIYGPGTCEDVLAEMCNSPAYFRFAYSCDDDADGDGVPDPCDNCPEDWNPDQADSDNDGIGDACDEEPQEQVPTVSEWGLVALALLLLTGAKVYFRRRGQMSV
jgi:hypothetical protein